MTPTEPMPCVSLLLTTLADTMTPSQLREAAFQIAGEMDAYNEVDRTFLKGSADLLARLAETKEREAEAA